MSAKLTATSYAILALLSRKSWSAYELNQHMQHSTIRVFWPRAQSHVYSEPKKLQVQGLVTGSAEVLNGRERTVYTITDLGMHHLQQWLREDDEGPVMLLQSSAMLKFLHADSAGVDVLHGQLSRAVEDAKQDAKDAMMGIESLLNRFEDTKVAVGMPFNGLSMSLMADIVITRYQWAKNAEQVLSTMTSTQATQESTALGKQVYSQALQRLKDAIEE